MREWKTFSPADIPCLRVLGRTTDVRSPLTLFWTASGIELNVKASELRVLIEADYGNFEPWLDILIDGARTQRLMLQKGKQEICVFRMMDPSVTRHVLILRDTPAMPKDDQTLLQIHGISTDGSFEELPSRDMKIEFIGDSITSGEGGCGAVGEMTWNSGCFDCVDNYTFMTARELNAEYHVLSQSGYGIFCDWRGWTGGAMPLYYTQVCGLAHGSRNEALGAGTDWDFSAWQPDVILVNLGTNDDGSFTFAGQWINGNEFLDPMRLNPDGTPNAEDLGHVEDAAVNFLKLLRAKNPEAQILWVYGMVGSRMMPTLVRAMERYLADSGDTRAELMPLADTLPGEFGSRQHPGYPAHAKTAAAIAERIRTLRLLNA